MSPVIGYCSGSLGNVVSTPYAGPGDIVASGWVFWCGLRAFSVATIGTKCVNLRRDSDNATQDFFTNTNGIVDFGAITVFKGNANLFVTKVYDQSGNSGDFAQATAANQIPFTLGVLNSKPVIDNTSALASVNLLGPFPTIAQPFSYTFVVTANHFANNTPFMGDSSVVNFVISDASGVHDNMAVFAGTGLNATAVDTAWHALNATLNSTSSFIEIDGNTTTGNAGTNAWTGVRQIALFNLAGTPFEGQMTEWGLLAGLSNAQADSLNANQRAFWGF